MFFQVHPDGMIRFSKGGLSYFDTLDNFHLDGSIALPQVYRGDGIIIDDAKSAYFSNGVQKPVNQMWDVCAQSVVDNIESYLKAQKKRMGEEVSSEPTQ